MHFFLVDSWSLVVYPCFYLFLPDPVVVYWDRSGSPNVICSSVSDSISLTISMHLALIAG